MLLLTDQVNAHINLAILQTLRTAGLLAADQEDLFDLSMMGGFATVNVDTRQLKNMIQQLDEMDRKERGKIEKNYEINNRCG